MTFWRGCTKIQRCRHHEKPGCDAAAVVGGVSRSKQHIEPSSSRVTSCSYETE